jgi:lantibiotic biosynthesis protein
VSSDRAYFLEAAARIGRRLCRDAIWADGRCNWLGWAKGSGAKQAIYRAMGPLLHDGTAGIGLFLTWLAHFTGDQIVRDTAEGAFAQALTAVDALADAGEYGFYSGLSGIAWCCAEAGTVLDHERLAVQGRAAILRTARIAPKPQRLNLFNGSAGLIPMLCAAAECEAREELFVAAVRHGEQLLIQALPTDEGWGCGSFCPPSELDPMGFAYGTSGIAAALVTLGTIGGRADFMAAAEEALRHERNHLRPLAGPSSDRGGLAQPRRKDEPDCAPSWCRGTSGIGFARLLMHLFVPEDAAILSGVEAAVSTAAAALAPAAPFSSDFSLCHGDAGKADLLLLAADLLVRPDLRCLAETAASRAVELFEEPAMPWPCGV